MDENNMVLADLGALGVTANDLNDPNYMFALADVIGAVNPNVAKFAANRGRALVSAGVPANQPSQAAQAKVISGIDNMVEAILNDEVTLASGTLNYAAFPSTPSAVGARTNYKRQPFNYDLLLIDEVKVRLNTMTITDAQYAELLDAQVVFRKGTREILKAPLSEFIGLKIANAVLDTSVKTYGEQAGSLKLRKPIALNNLDDIEFNITFVATTNVDAKKLKIYFRGMGKERYA